MEAAHRKKRQKLVEKEGEEEGKISMTTEKTRKENVSFFYIRRECCIYH